MAVAAAALLLAAGVRLCWISLVEIPGHGGQPVFLPGDRVAVNKTAYGLRLWPMSRLGYVRWGECRPGRGEWMAFNNPAADSDSACADQGPVFVGFCYAVPGDSLWVDTAGGVHRRRPADGRRCRVVDLPGCYSLLSGSAEENAARTFLLSHVPDAVIAVCDATRLESTLPLALQLLEMGLPVLLCVNLMDEAQRRGKSPDLSLLSERLSIPVIGTSANRRDGLGGLRQALAALLTADRTSPAPSFQIPCPADLETALSLLAPAVHRARLEKGVSLFPGERFLCLQLLEAFLPASSGTPRQAVGEKAEAASEAEYLLSDSGVRQAASSCASFLTSRGIGRDQLPEHRDAACRLAVQKLCQGLYPPPSEAGNRLSRLDRLLTGKWTAFPIMLLFLFFLFWLTIRGANVPSALLSSTFSRMEAFLSRVLLSAGCPPVAADLLVNGIFGTTGRVISVMLPPMAIFFPLFTLLEDAGILPRIAFNLPA